jgi:hypothetical protein
MPLHPAWLKNISRRVLWAALEKDITKIDREAMVEHFEAQCAYCGDALPERWHADHLLAVDKGGSHHRSNRVPSCPRCNEIEKQEKEWLEFLTFKCDSDAVLLDARTRRITAWKERHSPPSPTVSDAQRIAWQQEVDGLAAAIDSAWKRLRGLKDV